MSNNKIQAIAASQA